MAGRSTHVRNDCHGNFQIKTDVFRFELAFCNKTRIFFLSESIKLGILKSPLHLMNAYRLGRRKDDLQAEGYPAITPSTAVMGSKKCLLHITCFWILRCNLTVGE